MLLYKYQHIRDDIPPENNKCIENIFNAQVVFSSRKNFNDLFDSKIYFRKPRREQVRNFRKSIPKEIRAIFDSKTFGQVNFYNKLHIETEKLIDSYYFYCLTTDPLNNLMWSHYANSHKGFCIEWDSTEMCPDEVIYSNDLATIDLLDIAKSDLSLIDKGVLGDKLWAALRTKLHYWSYENEFRIKLRHSMNDLIMHKNEKFCIVSADPKWIKSIIFGVRCSEDVKTYIMKNIPHKVSFKQCVINNSIIYTKPI